MAPAAVGDDDRDVLERAVELERQIVDRSAHERPEVILVVRIEQVVVLVLVLAPGAFGREPFGALDERLEVGSRTRGRAIRPGGS